MRTLVFSLFTLVVVTYAPAQEKGNFPEFKTTYTELNLKSYAPDSSAVAVVLNEFGKAYFDNGNDYNLMFEYHVKIKIFKKEGLEYADIEIPLRKSDSKGELLRAFEAASYTFDNGSMRETKVGLKEMFTDVRGKYLDVKKIAIPNVREGSVIEFKYTLESPFVYNFRNWEFQAEIPKIYSEYWALIPANYLYNITLKGFFPLTTNASKVQKECYYMNGRVSDCSVFMYGMKDIPAFIEEEYMTAKSNFISSINFELSEYRYFDGRIDKMTKEWKDVEQELKKNSDFGQQLKKADGKMRSDVLALIADEPDPLAKAKKIYYHVLQNFQWNGNFGLFTDNGVKKAFEEKIGNVSDINLMLIGALDVAGLSVDPVILSTRDNGVPIELHPVISDFNYVVARLEVNGKFYLLDATDPFHPFGLLPERCLNGKGRVLADKASYWIDLVAPDKARRISNFSLKLADDGLLSGAIQVTYMGYEAVKQRKMLHKLVEEKAYILNFTKRFDGMEVGKFEILNFNQIDKPFVVKLDIGYQAYDAEAADNFLFNPFIIEKENENPFKSNERLYPVDFGSPREFTTMLNLEFPAKFELVNRPEKIALSLPNAGGRFILDSQVANNKLTLNNALTINRTVFSSQEYLYLKELYSRIIQAQNEDLIFKKKI
ncbi:MAG TPA: DUF3857 domain-containing protein [Chryseosolibacter sp.]